MAPERAPFCVSGCTRYSVWVRAWLLSVLVGCASFDEHLTIEPGDAVSFTIDGVSRTKARSIDRSWITDSEAERNPIEVIALFADGTSASILVSAECYHSDVGDDYDYDGATCTMSLQQHLTRFGGDIGPGVAGSCDCEVDGRTIPYSFPD